MRNHFVVIALSVLVSLLLLSFKSVPVKPGPMNQPRVESSGFMEGESLYASLDNSDNDPVPQTIITRASLAGFDPARLKASALGPMNPHYPFDASFSTTGSAPEGDTPTAAGFTTDGSRFVIANMASQNLSVFDADTRAFIESIELSGSPVDMKISSDGVHAVTANVFEDTVSIVNLVTGEETDVITVGDEPGVVGITPDGTVAVIGNTRDSTLSLIDIATATEIRQIACGDFVQSTTVNFEPGAWTVSYVPFKVADDRTVIFPDYFNNQIQIIDITTYTIINLPSAANPRGIDVSADGTRAAVAHASSAQTVSVIDLTVPSISKTIPIGANLYGSIAMKPDGTKAVVSVQNACRVVNLDTSAVGSNLNTASVYNLLTTTDGLYVLGVGYYGSLISFASESLVKNLNNTVSTPVGAVSPVEPRAVLVANVFGEDMVVVNTNGSSGYQEYHGPSGPPPEGDKARMAAMAPDGSRAVSSNIFSDNATILNLHTNEVEAIVDVGDRPAEVAITPDSSQAVVCNLDSTFVSVIDLNTHVVTNLSISRRQSQVEISPDGQYAYIAVVASGDGVWRIDLNTLQVAGNKLATGDMGGIYYLFNQTSGMTLSHDGATLVTCNSYSDTISIIDTASWSVVKNLAIGDFPVRATFSPDDSALYVSLRDESRVKIVEVAGSGSQVTGTINVGTWPLDIAVSPDHTTLYVLNYTDKNVGIVDLPGTSMSRIIPLPNAPGGMAMDNSGLNLFVPSGNWTLSTKGGYNVTFTKEGEVTVIGTKERNVVSTINTDEPPSMIASGGPDGWYAIPCPVGDGLFIVKRVMAPLR